MRIIMVLIVMTLSGCASGQSDIVAVHLPQIEPEHPDASIDLSLVETTQITDASYGVAAIPQLAENLYPPAVNDHNFEHDISNLEMYYYNQNPRKLGKALVMFGDSRVVLFQMSYRFPVTVYSFARGGSSSAGVINRLDNLKNMTSYIPHPEIGAVFIQVGINDVLGTNVGFNVTDFKANYRRIADYMRNNLPGVEVVIGDIITLNATHYPARDYDTIDDYNAFLKELCAEEGWALLEMNPLMSNSDRSLKAEYDADGIHFNKAGHDLMYNTIVGHFLNF